MQPHSTSASRSIRSASSRSPARLLLRQRGSLRQAAGARCASTSRARCRRRTKAQSRARPHSRTRLDWEYWNSRMWAPLPVTSNFADSKLDLDRTEVVDFTVPIDMVTGQGQRAGGALGARARCRAAPSASSRRSASRLTRRAAARPTPSPTSSRSRRCSRLRHRLHVAVRTLPCRSACSPTTTFTTPTAPKRPCGRAPLSRPSSACATSRRRSISASTSSRPSISSALFFDVVEAPDALAGPALVWEYWDGLRMDAHAGRRRDRLPASPRHRQRARAVGRQRTRALRRATHWLRARLKEDGPPGEPIFTGSIPTQCGHRERHTLHDLPLGTSNGTPNQVFSLTQTPVLHGERIEVRELGGARANVEWRILAMELWNGDGSVLAQLERLLARESTDTDGRDRAAAARAQPAEAGDRGLGAVGAARTALLLGADAIATTRSTRAAVAWTSATARTVACRRRARRSSCAR